ncbi:SDR family oxidoreductase [Acidaminobacter sp. JC074]|uniref:SDR family NAD(P)-dependent oxidoreductase n=1 Tax=Acidaminobacter sp. JC074 TaxID=2530199 RepID=UPI001F0F6176|nr:SDR family NAD(P)-dependent oxidoreductase [Acidaminobacter sp. JC074]MCH4891409.1 SDR family oxidoreductase [Acidaminobacter sp. JC074]
MLSYMGRVIVITGGATGIGYAFAKAMGLEGGKIVIASRRVEKVNEAVENLKALGIEASGTTCDVSKRSEVENLKSFANQKYGKVDVLMNNAGITQEQKPILQTDVKTYKKLFEINYYGVINCIQVFSEDLQTAPSAIYNVGSENSLFNGVPQASGYISTKHALLALTESLREEMSETTNISFIIPGLVQSELADGFLKGMDVDKFVSTIMKQLKENQFFCVAHAHNIVRVNKRYEALNAAYNTFAPRYENDDEFDVRTQINKLLQKEAI